MNKTQLLFSQVGDESWKFVDEGRMEEGSE